MQHVRLHASSLGSTPVQLIFFSKNLDLIGYATLAIYSSIHIDRVTRQGRVFLEKNQFFPSFFEIINNEHKFAQFLCTNRSNIGKGRVGVLWSGFTGDQFWD